MSTMSPDATTIVDALVAKGVEPFQVTNCLIMCRPKTVEAAEAWMAANPEKVKAHIAGQAVPADWKVGKDYLFAEGTAFEIGEVVVLNRSDGSTKFGLVQQLNDSEPGIHVVLVECGQEHNSVKRLRTPEIGKVHILDAYEDVVCACIGRRMARTTLSFRLGAAKPLHVVPYRTGMRAYKFLFFSSDSGHASTQQTPSLSFFLTYLLQLQPDDQS